MARNNLVMSGNAAFQQNPQYAPAPQYTQDPYGGQQGYAQPQYGQPQFGQQQGYSAEQLNAMYNQPAASGYDTGRMTWRDAMNAITATLGTIIVVAALVMNLPTVLALTMGEQGYAMGVGLASIAAIVGAIGGLVTVLINAFRRKPSAILTMVYAVFEGMFVGGISLIFESAYPGIVMQAVIGTLAVAGSIVLLYRSGKVRTSPKLNKIFFVAMLAYLLFVIANLILVLTTGINLRTGILGLAIGAIAVLLASYSLVQDLELVHNGVNNGAPRAFAWTAALGLAVTIVWMYTEILRLLAIFRGND